ncbi:hypothetical protein KI387_044267 [Taxus chinensis]|uniref:Uncharacterized protein n=1 Tax=Taxus chinensis TaxID=29808 RepID=A0AA38C9T5_TAXCH|nr:hypothetical protein KI387_044267 [Taxus chinensis]
MPAWYKEHDFYNYHHVKGHSDNNCITFKNIVQEMLDNRDLVLDNPNAPANQNLHIFKKPFPNHAPSSNQVGDTSNNDSNVREVHTIFDDIPVASQLPHVPSIDEILAQAPLPAQEPISSTPPPIEAPPSFSSSPVEEPIISTPPLTPQISEQLSVAPLLLIEDAGPPPTPTQGESTSSSPSSPLPMEDSIEVPVSFDDPSPLDLQDPVGLLSALLPTESEASHFPVSQTHFTGITTRSTSAPPMSVPFSRLVDHLDYVDRALL